ncbi:MAG: alpha/beta hydrolase fold domain-containing protein [Prolixibacteraceae bacterium]
MTRFLISKFVLLTIWVFLIAPLNSFSQKTSCFQDEVIYKQIDTVKLKMFIYKPVEFRKTVKYPTVVFFFGGGWVGGKIKQFDAFARHYASKNMLAVLVGYRVKERHGTTPFEALKDAKSAIRYLKENAKKIGVDPDKIVASGGSAGGHLAAACFTNETINEDRDNLGTSAKPNALVLFNPVIDNSKEGYGYDRIKEKYPEFSPLHNIREGFPPTIFFMGTKDKLIPVSTAELFKKKIEAVGGRCDLFFYEGQEHGFFNQKVFHDDILLKVDEFLQSIEYLKLD